MSLWTTLNRPDPLPRGLGFIGRLRTGEVLMRIEPVTRTAARRSGSTSLLGQHQIDRPTPSRVLAAAAAVGQQLGVGAARLFQRVGEDRQVVEAAVVVDGSGDPRRGGV